MSGRRRLFVDTNVFVASLTDEPDRGPVATEVLNEDAEFLTSLLNLMELRSVLTKKKQIELDRVSEAIDRIAHRVDVVVHESSDMIAANDLQRETLLYPADCLILAVADDRDATLVSFDSELLDNGATRPRELLD